MQYILALFNDEARWTTMSPEVTERETGAYMAYAQALVDAGAYVGGNRLRPTKSAVTVRVGNDGKTAVLDGPYVEAKEQLAGYFIIEAADDEAAIAWAARCPCAGHGTVEVRPIWEVPAAVAARG